ncbi:hypothetical protein IGI04_019616 [Brassica rapa subsp. trilocularis]|uniref:Uncharacterized protein n=1 Tax=Brassica rapa subsp. trilocularis TaxID=1813537 RepID=A0ABQ7MGC2_BRACM|nr:hypothetical protein IGI04_019616 [Brassica rapa subsp. trilocularis]
MDETRPRPRKREKFKLGAKRSAGKFAGKVPRKFTGDNPAIDLNPALDSVGPSSPTLHTRLGDFGCPWVILAHVGCLFSTHGRPCVSVSTHRTSVAVRQDTQDVRLSISTHISTLALPVDCSGDFGPRGLSVQYTQDIRGCPSAHTRRPWTALQYTYQHAGPSCGLFGTQRTSVAVRQHTQDVRVLSVCVRVSVSTHRTSVAVRQHKQDVHGLSISIHISTLALPADCSGYFGPCGLSVQYTHDVRGCPSAHTGRLCTVRVCPCVSVCPSAHTGRLWPSVSTHRTSMHCPSVHISARWPFMWTVRDVCGCPSAHTGRPSAHRGRPWLAISTRPWLAHQYTYQHAGTVRGLPISTYISMLTTHISMLALPVTPPIEEASTQAACDCHVPFTEEAKQAGRVITLPVDCPCTDFGQLMHHVSTHISMLVLPMDCPCTEFGQLMHQVSTYISMLALPVDCPCTVFGQLMHHVSTHISMLALPVDCPCTDFGQLMHHVSTHISMLALPVNCSCTDLDMSSSFDGLDCPSPLIDASSSFNELMVQVLTFFLGMIEAKRIHGQAY